MSSRRRLLPALFAVAALVAAAGLWLQHRAGSIDPAAGVDVVPPGRWHRVPTREGSEEMARVLSLPYTAGSRTAVGDGGVVAHDRDRAQTGVNLYVSGHGPEAVLMDNDGRVLHTWKMPFETAFPQRAATVETGFFRRAALLPSGSLIALYQGGGLIQLGIDSQIVWRVSRGLYNDFFVCDDGSILAIGKDAEAADAAPEDRASGPPLPVLNDFVLRISADGVVGERLSILDAFRASEYAPLLQPLLPVSDILHSNTITQLDGSLAGFSEVFAAGGYLVSLREVDVVGILDPATAEVVWAQKGPWDAQHEPVLLSSGNLLLFDNRGAGGQSRILEIEPLSGEIRWDYRGPRGRPLASAEAGTVQRLANGNTLITESEQGRAFEIDAGEQIVWEFASPHRAGPNRELVATLFEVVRYPRAAAEFLRERRRASR